MTIDDCRSYLREHWPEIREQLLSGTYEPQPVRRVEIPEAGRRGEEAWHTLRRRSIDPAGGAAGAARAVGTRRFPSTAMGFARGARRIRRWRRRKRYIAEGYRWVVDIDLEKFFDRVNHDRLMAKGRGAGGRQASAEADPGVSKRRGDGGRVW